MQQAEADYRVFLQEQINQADVIKIFEQERSSLDQLGVLQQKHLYWGGKEKPLYGSPSDQRQAYVFRLVSVCLRDRSGKDSGRRDYLWNHDRLFVSGKPDPDAGILHEPDFFQSGGRAGFRRAGAGNFRAASGGASGKPGTAPAFRCFCRNPVGKREVFLITEKKSVPGSFPRYQTGELYRAHGSFRSGKNHADPDAAGVPCPGAGKVLLYDQKENRAVCSPETRRYISYVPQGDTLFSGTIAANLRAGKADATEEQMRGALEAACALEFVDSLPEGLHTEIGEKGYGLSEDRPRGSLLPERSYGLRPC